MKKIRSILWGIRTGFLYCPVMFFCFFSLIIKGKFTLQLEIKKAFEHNNCSCFHLSTEHHGELFGAGFVFADGYENEYTINLECEKCIDFLQRIMVYIDNISKDDIILVGQSRLIPYDICTQTFIRSATFLEGIKPDIAIVVINPYVDSSDYIEDTIHALKSIYKCRTIALAYSDNTVNWDENGKIIKCPLSDSMKKELNEYCSSLYQLPVGCITDKNFIDSIVNSIFDICKEF